ncbi:NAD(P)-dependent oxidoreductase [candidate division KSB1 bacterium]|nr:NAD(P)-dependent oxidoreductase [candidate division KSB1 bacterium]RQW07660.1 MAG: NAD(P)-dependent oxidoreductase [candidate division KSB1 bacterium]
MERIGFIGLGIMGRPMCLNLLRAGYRVTVWNRTATKAMDMTAAGAEAAASPKELASNADVIITMVSDSPDVVEVILGEQGVVQGAGAGSVVIDMSTISPAVTRDIAARLAQKGVAMLDAPVSGGDTGAVNATLAIMVGGDKDVFYKCLPIFQAMGKAITHVGGNGMGQTVKLCNQILVSVTNMAVCEAVTFARASGVDPHIMIEATRNGAAGSWQLANLGPKIVARDFAPGFMIDLQQKDLRLALEAAREVLVATPALSLVHQLFIGNQAHAEGGEGTQALVKSIERLAAREKR